MAPRCGTGGGFVTPPLAIDAGGTVNTKTGAVIVSGAITCPGTAALTVRVTLRQSQKLGKVYTTVEATGETQVACGGSRPGSVALAPPSGGCRNGTATATARTINAPSWFNASETSRSVKLDWGRK